MSKKSKEMRSLKRALQAGHLTGVEAEKASRAVQAHERAAKARKSDSSWKARIRSAAKAEIRAMFSPENYLQAGRYQQAAQDLLSDEEVLDLCADNPKILREVRRDVQLGLEIAKIIRARAERKAEKAERQVVLGRFYDAVKDGARIPVACGPRAPRIQTRVPDMPRVTSMTGRVHTIDPEVRREEIRAEAEKALAQVRKRRHDNVRAQLLA